MTAILDPAYIDSMYAVLPAMELHLDADPLLYGPRRLNGKIAETRAMLGQCERIFLDVSQRLSVFKREFRKATLVVEMQKKYLLASDPLVRAERSVSDREAAASMHLQNEIHEVHRLEAIVADLEDLMLVIKAKRADLRDSQGRLRDQIRLCGEEINLGSKWGSARPGARDIAPTKAAKPASSVVDDLDDIDALIASVDSELEIPVSKIPQAEMLDDTTIRAQVRTGFQAPVTPAPAPFDPALYAVPSVNTDEAELEDETEEDEDEDFFASIPHPVSAPNLVSSLGGSNANDVDSFLNEFAPPPVLSAEEKRRIREEQDSQDILEILGLHSAN